MKKLLVTLCSFCVIISSSVFSQSNDGEKILMTVGNEKITLQEFLNVYNKNNSNKNVEQKNLQEYLELYVNFRLKVKEAKEMGLDTTAEFKNELSGYRKQLVQPYLTDTIVSDKLLKEAYDRMQWDLRASHILIKCDPNALPKDTLLAYNKTMDFYNRIKKGEKFEDIANKYSEDPYINNLQNGGDLGFFTTLIGYVYPFESVAYSLKVGDVSKPVRTQFGYHIIKLTDKVKHEEYTVSHIMLRYKPKMNKEDSLKVKENINLIYAKLQKGDTAFSDIAKTYSEDPASAKKGGILPVMTRHSNFPPEFKNESFKLTKEGSYTAPFETRFGWHIVQLNSKKSIEAYDKIANEIKMMVAKDMRSNITRDALINKIKKWYNYKEVPAAKNEMTKFLDTNIYLGEWNAEKAKKLTKVIFTIADKKFTQGDFAKYIEANQVKYVEKPPYYMIINSMFLNWCESELVAYEESKLDSKYPKFKALMDEYRDGILLFDLTDKKVWSKAVKDTSGLKEYHQANKSKWMWDEKASGTTYTCKDEKTAEKVKKLIAKNKSEKEILETINKKEKDLVKTEFFMVFKGDNKLVDANWKPGITPNINQSGKVVFANIEKIIPPAPKTLNEAKGLVTSDYQTYLEKQWLEDLKKKYQVNVNNDVLKLVK